MKVLFHRKSQGFVWFKTAYGKRMMQISYRVFIHNICVYMYIQYYIDIDLDIQIYTCIYIYIHTMCVYIVCVYTCRLCRYRCVYAYVYIYTQTYAYTYTQIVSNAHWLMMDSPNSLFSRFYWDSVSETSPLNLGSLPLDREVLNSGVSTQPSTALRLLTNMKSVVT